MTEKDTKNWWNYLPAALFVAAVFLGAILLLVLPQREFSETENRVLCVQPDLTAAGLLDGTYQEQIEESVNDQFPARTVFMRAHTLCERMFAKRMVNHVVYADGGYLIEHVADGDVDEERAASNVEHVAESAAYFAGRLGMEHVRVFLAPAKEDYLADLLPPHFAHYDGGQITAQMQERLGEEMVVDCEPILRQADLEQTFYYTDHHWTTEAAYAVYRAWCGQMGEHLEESRYETCVLAADFYGTTHSKTLYASCSDTITIYRTDTELAVSYPDAEAGEPAGGIYREEALAGKNKYDVFFGGNPSMAVIHNEAGNGRRLLLFKDSFANCFAPFLAEHYTDILMIDLRYLNRPLGEVLEEFGEVDDVYYFFNTVKLAKELNLYKLADAQMDDGDGDGAGDDIFVGDEDEPEDDIFVDDEGDPEDDIFVDDEDEPEDDIFVDDEDDPEDDIFVD